METTKTTTEEEIQQALRSFAVDGGRIKKLPGEIVSPFLLVGKKYGMYENIFDHHLTSESAAQF